MRLLRCWSGILEETKNTKSTLRRILVHSEAHGVVGRLGRSQMKMLARYPNLEMKKRDCMLLAICSYMSRCLLISPVNRVSMNDRYVRFMRSLDMFYKCALSK